MSQFLFARCPACRRIVRVRGNYTLYKHRHSTREVSYCQGGKAPIYHGRLLSEFRTVPEPAS